MSRLPAEVDVAIIGAGAAGLGAAHALKNSGLFCLILEARNRIGGRAHTLQLQDNIIFDEGCGWLHAANLNSFVPIAEELGFAISKERPPWEGANAGVNHGRDGFDDAMDAFYGRLHKGAKTGTDVPASAWLEPGNKWNAAIESAGTYINGCRLDQVSTHDLDAYEATGKNWRVKKGYGALVAAYGSICPVSLATKVTLIDHSSKPHKIETSRGTLRARAIIVTVPTDLIANEAVRFSPPLPEKREAASNLPLGVANKIMIAIEGADELPEDGVALNRVDKGAYHVRPFGQPCIEGYFGGDFARRLDEAGEGALAAQAIDEIVASLGEAFRPRLKPLHESRWVSDEFARGSYSYARVGHSKDRAKLAAPVGTLFFAGEATSPNFFSTAHGARDSGERAAGEVMKAIGRAIV